jgi:membrane dipeptidase
MQKKLLLIAMLSFFVVCKSFTQQKKYLVTEAKAKEIVDRVLKTSPIIDGHNDVLRYYFDCRNCPRDFTAAPLDTISRANTDIPRWKKGGVGGQLLNIFGSELSARSTMDGYDLVYRMIEAYKQHLVFTPSVAEVRKAMTQKKIAIIPAMEFSVRLENSLAMLRIFHKLGLRAVTLAYQTNGIADGSDDTVRHHGLSPLGKQMLAEMNQLGVMADISHVSEKTMMDVLELSRAPVIFSHSNAKAICNVNRNVSDDVLKRLKKNKGIIMLTFVPYFTTSAFADWYKKGDDVWIKLKEQYKDSLPLAIKDMEKWEKENSPPPVTISDMADHFDHVKKIIGVDHIGIGSDFDGIDYFISGLEDVSTYPALLTELARRGWTERELKNITSQNFLRVFEQVEKQAASLSKRTGS